MAKEQKIIGVPTVLGMVRWWLRKYALMTCTQIKKLKIAAISPIQKKDPFPSGLEVIFGDEESCNEVERHRNTMFENLHLFVKSS